MPCEMLGISIGMVNRMLQPALKRMPERWMQAASRKDRPTEITVEIRVVSTEFLSIGKN